jgi:hypothetical protein
MSLFNFLFPLAGAVNEMERHNRAMEDQHRRSLLTPAERAAEDAAKVAERARWIAKEKQFWGRLAALLIVIALGLIIWSAIQPQDNPAKTALAMGAKPMPPDYPASDTPPVVAPTSTP